jgi:hypothetical protein
MLIDIIALDWYRLVHSPEHAIALTTQTVAISRSKGAFSPGSAHERAPDMEPSTQSPGPPHPTTGLGLI